MCVIQIACVSLSALLAVNLQPTTVMPSEQQRARLKRLSRQLQSDHPGVRTRLDSPSSRRDRRRAPRQNAESTRGKSFWIIAWDGGAWQWRTPPRARCHGARGEARFNAAVGRLGVRV